MREDDSYLFDLDNKVGRRPLCRPPLSRWKPEEEGLGGQRGGEVGPASGVVVDVTNDALPSGWRGVLHRRPLLRQHQPLHQPLV